MSGNIYRTIVIEDEPKDLDFILYQLKGFQQITVVATVNDVDHAIAAISVHKPDLIFTDIELYGEKAFRILDVVKEYGISPKVVFTTAHEKYEMEVLRYAGFDFLLKPIDKDDLSTVISRLEQTDTLNLQQKVEKYNDNLKNKLIFNTQNGYEIISIPNIIYIEADESYSKIFLDNVDKEIVVSRKLGQIEEQLPQELFMRIHRSFLVRINSVLRIKNGNCIVQYRGQSVELKVAKQNIDELLSRL